jgi:hypothetical protein
MPRRRCHLSRHTLLHTAPLLAAPAFFCPREGCRRSELAVPSKPFTSAGSMNRHYRSMHSDARESRGGLALRPRGVRLSAQHAPEAVPSVAPHAPPYRAPCSQHRHSSVPARVVQDQSLQCPRNPLRTRGTGMRTTLVRIVTEALMICLGGNS